MKAILSCNRRVSGRERFEENAASIESLVRRVAPAGALVEINLVGEKRMARLNREFKRRRGPAEILSFAYGAEDAGGPEDPVGEIYLCWPRLMQGARRRGVRGADYLLRLIAHGLCHIKGHTHDDESSEREMEEVEKELLRGLVDGAVVARLFA